jgi:hypothetical protein
VAELVSVTRSSTIFFIVPTIIHPDPGNCKVLENADAVVVADSVHNNQNTDRQNGKAVVESNHQILRKSS